MDGRRRNSLRGVSLPQKDRKTQGSVSTCIGISYRTILRLKNSFYPLFLFFIGMQKPWRIIVILEFVAPISTELIYNRPLILNIEGWFRELGPLKEQCWVGTTEFSWSGEQWENPRSSQFFYLQFCYNTCNLCRLDKKNRIQNLTERLTRWKFPFRSKDHIFQNSFALIHKVSYGILNIHQLPLVLPDFTGRYCV